MHVGQFANPAVIRRDLQPLRDLYYEKGYYNVVINTDSTVVDANNMQDLVVTHRARAGRSRSRPSASSATRTWTRAACAAP